jgi:hypothetical protein
MTKAENELDAGPDVADLREAPREINEAPPDLPSCETRARRFPIRAAPGVEIGAEVLRIAEFWLNVAEGEALWALLLACERMSQIGRALASVEAIAPLRQRGC